MGRFGVRRLAAVDMHGAAGTTLRRRLILAEFLAGFPFCLAVGLLLIAAGGITGWVLGIWVIGCGVNYVALALHALSLRRPGALAAELGGVDLSREGHYYTVAQWRVLIPLLVAIIAVGQLRMRRPLPKVTPGA